MLNYLTSNSKQTSEMHTIIVHTEKLFLMPKTRTKELNLKNFEKKKEKKKRTHIDFLRHSSTRKQFPLRPP